jgi:hypothetical protein
LGGLGGPIPHFETSARTACNVEGAFLELATLAVIYAEKNKKEEPMLSYAPMGGHNNGRRIDLHHQGSSSYASNAYGGNDCC